VTCHAKLDSAVGGRQMGGCCASQVCIWEHCSAGVLQVEAMAQLGGIVMLDPEGPSKDQFFFGGIEKCRFKKPVVPGDTLVSALPIINVN
jgi:FabA-like domain